MVPAGVCCRAGKAWSASGEIAPFARKRESKDKSTSMKAVAMATVVLVSLVADRRRHIGVVRHHGATGYDQGARARGR